jgi:hypothetical protein
MKNKGEYQMPDPNKYKDKHDFMNDCMHQTRKVENEPQDKAVAICLNMWKEKGKKKSAADYLRFLSRELMRYDI